MENTVLNPETFSAFTGGDDVSFIQEVQKAFEAGEAYDLASMTGGQAGRIESLESTFKVITHKLKSAAFWNDIPKDKATSTVLEYARINEVGDASFYEEGGDVDREEDDQDRQVDIVRFAGVKGAVTFAAKSVKLIQAAEVNEQNNKTKSLVRYLDTKLWEGDSSVNSLEISGVFKKAQAGWKNPSQNMIDLRGKRLSDEVVNDATTIIKDNHGEETLKLWLSHQGVNGYVQDKIANKTYYTNAGGSKDLSPTDQKLNTFSVSNGDGEVKSDVFLRAQNTIHNRLVNKAQTALKKAASKGPNAPTVTAVDSELSTTTYDLDDGSYEYLIVPYNKYGDGLGVETVITHTGGGKRTKFTLEAANTGETTLGYTIYRRPASSDLYREYQKVGLTHKKTSDAETIIYDDGEFIPGTTWGAMIEWDSDQTICVKQLADMMKLPYGIRADKKEWLQKVYLVLQIFNENRIVLFKNIGALPN